MKKIICSLFVFILSCGPAVIHENNPKEQTAPEIQAVKLDEAPEIEFYDFPDIKIVPVGTASDTLKKALPGTKVFFLCEKSKFRSIPVKIEKDGIVPAKYVSKLFKDCFMDENIKLFIPTDLFLVKRIGSQLIDFNPYELNKKKLNNKGQLEVKISQESNCKNKRLINIYGQGTVYLFEDKIAANADIYFIGLNKMEYEIKNTKTNKITTKEIKLTSKGTFYLSQLKVCGEFDQVTMVVHKKIIYKDDYEEDQFAIVVARKGDPVYNLDTKLGHVQINFDVFLKEPLKINFDINKEAEVLKNQEEAKKKNPSADFNK